MAVGGFGGGLVLAASRPFQRGAVFGEPEID